LKVLEHTQSAPVLFQHQKNSAAIRIWHWFIFIGFSASLITVWMGSTLFKTKDNISLVIDNVARNGGVVTKAQAQAVAHDYSDKLWDMHRIIGYILSFLFFSRVIIEIFQHKNERLQNRIRYALSLRPANRYAISQRNLYLLVKRGYLLFYILFLMMALTGLVMAFDEVAFLKPLRKTADSIHLFVQC
jgi:hypothetical protein